MLFISVFIKKPNIYYKLNMQCLWTDDIMKWILVFGSMTHKKINFKHKDALKEQKRTLDICPKVVMK